MRFLVDNQLPIALARFLREQGHDVMHVADIGLDEAEDQRVLTEATRLDCVIVSKDEDLFLLANKAGAGARLLWIRLGSCRNTALLAAVGRSLDAVIAAFGSGQRIVELT